MAATDGFFYIVDDSADISWLTDERFIPFNVKKGEKYLVKIHQSPKCSNIIVGPPIKTF